MKVKKWIQPSGIALAAALFAGGAHAIELDAGEWKFTANGNVNVHYINSQCEDSPQAITTVGGACVADGLGEDGVSTVSNGLLPAALVFGATTQQKGYDLGFTFGLYPGISTNDGGSPNVQAGASNTALGTAGLDVRQVFMTFGNANIGTFTLGRNFGLFGFDAIINDMTIPGVGVGGAMSGSSPANTSLGSIGFGYIYTDTLAQMNYTTPDFGGLKFTVGIFDPIEPLLQPVATNKSAPGFHGKVAYSAGGLSLSATFISQDQETAGGGYTSTGFDVFANYILGSLTLTGSYYNGSGMGTTALFVLSDDGNGNERDSDGYLLQAKYAIGDTALGVNYGVSNLDFANAADQVATPNLVEKNSKITVGVYHSLTPNLTLLAEFSDVETEAHNGASNESSNFNIGAFLSF
jgi:predicted porin